MEAISWETIRKVNQPHNQGMANIIQVHSTVAQPSKHVMREVLGSLTNNATNFDPQNLSNTLWAVARFG